MLVYNTTFHCEKDSYEEFVAWLRSDYIPTAMQCEGLSEPRMARIMTQDESEGVSVSLQFVTPDLNALHGWYEKCGVQLVATLEERYAQRVAGFATIMEQLPL